MSKYRSPQYRKSYQTTPKPMPFCRNERKPLLARTSDRLMIIPGALMADYHRQCLGRSAVGMGFEWSDSDQWWQKVLSVPAAKDTWAVLGDRLQLSEGMQAYLKTS